ncbi:MAG TPA: response regulator [Gemmatimonadales bacterium]|nr:response regulator [Gemmatimonadales bacterium]
MAAPLHLLLVEDSEDDALLLLRELTRAGFAPVAERVDNRAAMESALDRQSWDLVIGDYSMPHFGGPDALALVRERGLEVPFIIVSGTIGEERAVAAMKAGASDYVPKGNLKRLVPVIERELREAAGRRERLVTAAALRAAEASYSTLVENAPVGIYRSTPAGRFLSANIALARILGYDSVAEVLGLDLTRGVYADPAERQRLLDRDSYTDREYDEVETTWKRRDGGRLTVQLSVRAVRRGDGSVEYYETFVRDLTQQRGLEAQLLHAQKMEAVGRLAGGVAHDFNNLLTVILSYSDLLLEDLPSDRSEREDIEEIRKAAVAASSLTRQLLAFSRQQVLQPRVLDINGVVTATEKLLTRLLGEDVRLTTSLASDLGAVKVDPGQLEQIIMNLAVNARDAMPRGGRLTIETANVDMDEAYVRGHPVAQPGRYAMLAVSDTGIGMDAETQARIFEPFFTTKDPGKGTGLGLATVYGIVKQSGGFIWVYSEPGHGTSFKIYLPRVDDAARSAPAASAPVVGGSETVLVVEDVPAVRAVASEMLTRYGYTVLEAADAETALRLAAKHDGEIHLLLTDVVMPDASGRELADKLVKLKPGMKVLYMSGYTDDAVVRHGVLQDGIAFLQKPFTPESLARKLRTVLDQS